MKNVDNIMHQQTDPSMNEVAHVELGTLHVIVKDV